MRATFILVLCLAACDPERSGLDDDILTINEEEAVDDVQTVDDNGNAGGSLDDEEEAVDVEDDGTLDGEELGDEDNDGILDEDDPDFGLFEE